MESTIKRVIAHYRQMARKQPQYAPIRMAELAPGVVAVEDAAGECDVLFDATTCRFKDPGLWEPPHMTPSPTLKAAGLKVLPGLGRAPQVDTIEKAGDFARAHLIPVATWYKAPQFVEGLGV